MQVVKPRVPKRMFGLRHWATGCLLAAALLGAGSVHAYVPPLDALYEQLIAGAPSAGSAIIDLQCRVFPLDQAVGPGQRTPDAVRTFRQRVYWVRGKFLAVDTMAEDGTVLHVFLSEGGFAQSSQISPTRRFAEADVRPLVFPFLEGKTVTWTDELNFWGVHPTAVDFVLMKTVQAYRMSETPDKALWLDKEFNRPVKLSTRIDGAAAPAVITVEFSDFISFATKAPEKDRLRIPRKYSYALDGKVFKDVYMTEYEVDPPARKFPLARLRQQAAAPSAARPQ